MACSLIGASSISHAETHTWTGSGNNALWSDAANWQGNNPPRSAETGAALVFPAGSSRLNSTNDLSGLTLTQLIFNGTGFQLNGTNAFVLNSELGNSLIAIGSSNRVAVPIVLQTTNSFYVPTNASVSLAGRLTGAGAFTLVGGGMLALAPAGGIDNTYLGTTRVLEGILKLESAFRTDPVFGTRYYATAVPGELVVGNTGSLAPAILTGMALSTNTGLTLLGSGQYLVNGDLLAFGSLAGDGSVDFQGQSFVVGGNNRSTVFSGWMNGSSDAGLQKVGSGMLTLTGGDLGPVHLGIGEGTLIVDGTFSNSTAVVGSAMNGLAGGKLEGNGSLQMIFADGPVSPGNHRPGRLTAAQVVFDLDSSLVVKLGGTNAGIDYDQLVASESCVLVDPTAALKVQMLPGFIGAAGNQYTIVRLDSTNSVGLPIVPLGSTNGFNGLAEGSVLTLANGAAFHISYQGGDGNDIVLTQIATPPFLNPPSPLATGAILVSGTGYPGTNYEVQATTNLVDSSDWLTLGTTLALADGSLSFVHTNALMSPQQYYRLHAP